MTAMADPKRVKLLVYLDANLAAELRRVVGEQQARAVEQAQPVRGVANMSRFVEAALRRELARHQKKATG